jgi:N-sulfoglucosamine sulfohydrolase
MMVEANINHNLRYSTTLFIFLVLLGWNIEIMATEGEDIRPNFVLFIGDDISYSDFGCYGHPTIQTPNIDILSVAGVRFTNAYLTTSSCSPTRTSLITGRYPHNTGAPELHQNDLPHLGNLPQFPHLLRQAGYFTAQAGKWHFNGDASKSFDTRIGGSPSGAENWIPTLRQRPKNQPFFMWFAAHDAHRGWDQSISKGPHRPQDVQVPPYQIDGTATREDLAHYYNEVHRLDANIGLVINELKRQGVFDNTVIILMADNGRPFPRDKTWLYDTGIKTPLVVHWPAGISSASTPLGLVSTVDLAPTILELAGVEYPPTFQGVSLVPMFREPETQVRDYVFAERNWHGQRYHDRMVRHGDFVYIRCNLPQLTGFNIVHFGTGNQPSYSELVNHWRTGDVTAPQKEVIETPRPAEMLFNVVADSLQLNNLARKPEYAGKLELLRKALDIWTKETGDTLPKLGDMTPDRNERETWKPVPGLTGHPDGGKDWPGLTTKAWAIYHPGPVKD